MAQPVPGRRRAERYVIDYRLPVRVRALDLPLFIIRTTNVHLVIVLVIRMEEGRITRMLT